jgi:hypothetical protein
MMGVELEYITRARTSLTGLTKGTRSRSYQMKMHDVIYDQVLVLVRTLLTELTTGTRSPSRHFFLYR